MITIAFILLIALTSLLSKLGDELEGIDGWIKDADFKDMEDTI
jgi:hypothetical protein